MSIEEYGGAERNQGRQSNYAKPRSDILPPNDRFSEGKVGYLSQGPTQPVTRQQIDLGHLLNHKHIRESQGQTKPPINYPVPRSPGDYEDTLLMQNPATSRISQLENLSSSRHIPRIAIEASNDEYVRVPRASLQTGQSLHPPNLEFVQDRSRNNQPDSTLPRQRYESHKPKRPAMYDGKSSCKDYLVQFDMISCLNGWDEVTKAMELATNLSGIARSILTDVDPVHRQDYGRLVKALLTRFEPENQTEIFRAQLKSRLRKRSEDLGELAQEIKKLARKAYPGEECGMRDTITRDAFIDALIDGDMEWFVRQGKPSSVDGALQLALEYEAFLTGRQRRLGTKPVVRNTRESNLSGENDIDLAAQTNEIVGRISQVVQKSSTGGARGKRACYICGSHDHLKWDCPKNTGPKRPRVGECNHCGIPGHKEVDCYKKKRGDPKKQVNSPLANPTPQGNDE